MTSENIVVSFIIFIIACCLIMKTTRLFVAGAASLGLVLGFSKIFIGVTLVSLVTTTPELVVSVSASLLGQSGLAVGNALGSYICNIGLILAVGSLLKDIHLERKELMNKGVSLLTSLGVVYLFIADGLLNRTEAAVLIILQAAFLFYSYRAAVQARKKMKIEDRQGCLPLKKSLAYFLGGGAATVLLARYGLVGPAVNIAMFFQVPMLLIGLTMVAVGTSLPELFTSIVSTKNSQGEFSFGNVIGANIMNLLLILGVAGLICPLTIERQVLVFTMPLAVLMTVALLALGIWRLKFDKTAGIVLLGIYAIYLLVLFKNVS